MGMATMARGEMLRVGLQGWALEGSCCDHGEGALKWKRVKVIRLRPGWWIGHEVMRWNMGWKGKCGSLRTLSK